MATESRGEPRKRAKKENQEEGPRKRARKENQEEEPKKEKPPASIEGKDESGGWKDSSLTLRMTALVGR